MHESGDEATYLTCCDVLALFPGLQSPYMVEGLVNFYVE